MNGPILPLSGGLVIRLGAQDGGDPGSALIVSGVIAMARALGLKTIAEGIETAEQAAMLAREGSDEVQGILVC